MDSVVKANTPVGEVMDEHARLAYYESIIERGRQTFVEVGTALMEIREARLYREQGFGTFEDYCQERWGWGARRARQLTDAAEVVLQIKSGTVVPLLEDDIGVSTIVDTPMSPMGDIPLPTTERQVRELKKTDDPEIRRAAWQFAIAENGPNATAAEVRDAVETVTEVVKEYPDILKTTAGQRDRMEALARIGQRERMRTPPQREITFADVPLRLPPKEPEHVTRYWKAYAPLRDACDIDPCAWAEEVDSINRTNETLSTLRDLQRWSDRMIAALEAHVAQPLRAVK